MSDDPNCPCDVLVHPEPLHIDAGLSAIPRQIATFSQFRRAMLAALPSKTQLAGWRARGDQDLGVMLIEMWAYVCDVLGFYDEAIAHESYLRTARLDPSVRKLVALLGYRPRPAVGARVRLAIQASDRQPLWLAQGLAFRSSAFGSEPPQVFELDADTKVHPLLNGWRLAPVRPATLVAGTTTLLLAAASARAKVGDHLLLLAGGTPVDAPFTAKSVVRTTGQDGAPYVKVTLDRALTHLLSMDAASLLRPTAATNLWTNTSDTSSPLIGGGTTITLAGVVPNIKLSSYILASLGSDVRAFQVSAIAQSLRTIAKGTQFKAGDTNISTPDVRAPVTVLTLTPAWPTSAGWTDATKIAIEYALGDAGALSAELKAQIAPLDALHLSPPVEAPPDQTTPTSLLIEDADGTSQELRGGVDFAERVLKLAQGEALAVSLTPPVSVRANVVSASRGERVPLEVLGVGNGSLASQTFTLKKKPLTYLSASTSADPNGVANTLVVWVRDIQWAEVVSFFGVASDAEVYIVRQNDADESRVVFGDGVRGARLPNGATVTASYRFGAGAASPPAHSITQLAKPVKGLTAVTNPIQAAGGSDTQPATQLRSYAPRSALLFGRAVSIKDMEALAAGQPGVQAVSAGWTWDATSQSPAVQIYYIGSAAIAQAVRASLRSATPPATPIQASPAVPIASTLSLDLTMDRRHRASAVQSAVVAALSAPSTGLLSPERIGIGTPLYRSRILAEVLAIEGVASVRGIVWNGADFTAYGQLPASGHWFAVALTVHVAENQNG